MRRFGTAVLLWAACNLVCLSAAYGAAMFAPKLFLSSDGLALSSFPHRKALTKTITVTRTLGKVQVSWSAASDQSWLTVTSSGVTGGRLTIKANPQLLQKDQFYSAKVTVSTSGGDFSDTETLHVGLWVGSADPATVTLQQDALKIAANPVQPVAYVATGGSSVLEYNVYSGKLVATMQNVAPTVAALAVSSDGGTLFAADTTNYKIIAVDLGSGKKVGTFSLGYPINPDFNMVYARPFGQPAIYAAGGPIIAFPSGTVLAGGIPADFIAVTPDGNRLYGVTIGVSPGTLSGYYVGLKNGKLSIKPNSSVSIEGENCQALAVSHQGIHVYTACGWPYQFDVYDGKTLSQVQTLPAYPYPNNFVVDVDNNAVGGINGLYEQSDIYVFNQQGFSLGTVPTTPQSEYTGQQSAAMDVSGDGTRVISVTAAVYNSSQTLMFRNLP